MSTIADDAASTPTDLRDGTDLRTLAGLALAALLASLGTSIANVALPALAAGFDAPFGAVQWVVISYLLAMTAAVVGVGRLGDLVGRGRLLVAGIALFSAASAAAGLAPTLPVLVAARAAQGLGAAVMTALAVAVASEAASTGRTGRAMGLLGTMSAAGTALGPSMGGALVAAFGWRAVFLATVPLGLVAVALIRRGAGSKPSGTSGLAGFDVAGAAVLAATLLAFALAMTTLRGGVGLPGAGLLAAAAGGAAAFVAIEARAASPLLRPGMLREPALAAGSAANALVATVMMATLIVGPFHLAGGLGLGAAATGLAMSVGPVVAAFTGVPAGALVDRFGPRWTALAGLGSVTAGCAALSVLPLSAGAVGYLGGLAVVTAGYALFQAANTTASLAAAGPDRRGVVSGLLNLSRNMGLIAGASLMGAVFAAAVGSADVAAAGAAAIGAGTRLTFAVAAMLAVAAATIVAALRDRAVRA